MQVLSISTYDYLQSTCLHYIYELELILYRPRLWLIYDEYDYLQSTCLHYIYELELVLYHPRLWLIYDEYHPTNSPIQCLRIFHILFLLSYYGWYYCYTCYKIIAITVTVTVTAAIKTIILLCYWSVCCRYLISRCGWIDNSTANTCKYSLAPLVSNL
jgi:hypothetical protein